MDVIDPRVPPSLVPVGSRPHIVNGPKREYQDLPSIITPDGMLISRWTFTDAERLAIAHGEDLYLTMFVGRSNSINPISMSVGPCDWNY